MILGVNSTPGYGSQFHFTLKLQLHSRKLSTEIQDLNLATVTHQSLRALIADDLDDNRIILRRCLEDLGIHVTSVNSGQDVLSAFQNEDFDMVFLDIQMPDLSGLEVVNRARRSRPDSRTKYVAVSASVLQHQQNLYTSQGFHAVVPKPYKFEAIRDCIMNLLETSFTSIQSPPRDSLSGETILETGFDSTLATKNPLKILLADDYDVNRQLGVHLLNGFGYQCELAATGVEVLRKLDE